eukprot:340947-Pyramimonas_sp.AAC.1
MTAVPGELPSAVAARLAKASTVAVCLPKSAAQARPGSDGGLGGDPECRVTFVILGPRCPPRLAA